MSEVALDRQTFTEQAPSYPVRLFYITCWHPPLSTSDLSSMLSSVGPASELHGCPSPLRDCGNPSHTCQHMTVADPGGSSTLFKALSAHRPDNAWMPHRPLKLSHLKGKFVTCAYNGALFGGSLHFGGEHQHQHFGGECPRDSIRNIRGLGKANKARPWHATPEGIGQSPAHSAATYVLAFPC